MYTYLTNNVIKKKRTHSNASSDTVLRSKTSTVTPINNSNLETQTNPSTIAVNPFSSPFKPKVFFN